MSAWDALDALDRLADALQGVGHGYFDDLTVMLAEKRRVLVDMEQAEARRRQEAFAFQALQDEHQFQADRAAARAARAP